MKISQNNRILNILIVLLISFSLGLTGCSTGSSNSQVGEQRDKGTIKTKVVIDCLGREVQVPETVNRIGCLYAFSGHVVTMLDRGEDIVAVVDGLKRDKLLTEMVPGIKEALVPSSAGAINIEELIKANPDLVFVNIQIGKNPGETEKLEKSKIPYLVVDFSNIKEQQFAIEMIGKAIGAEEKAREYNTYYQNCVDRIGKRTAEIPENEKVRLYHSVNEAVRTDSIDTLPADWTRVAGAINVSVNEELKLVEEKHFASLEQIFLWDPDVIIANEVGVPDYILTNPQWAGLRAVKEKKVYQMPNGISRWGHPGSLETPLAILWTAKILYPQIFSDIDMAEETKAFYKQFFNYQLDDDTVSRILAGKGMRITKEEKANEPNN